MTSLLQPCFLTPVCITNSLTALQWNEFKLIVLQASFLPSTLNIPSFQKVQFECLETCSCSKHCRNEKKKGRHNEPAPFKLKNQTSVPYLLQQEKVTSSCLVNSRSNVLSSSPGYLLVVVAFLLSLHSPLLLFAFFKKIAYFISEINLMKKDN